MWHLWTGFGRVWHLLNRTCEGVTLVDGTSGSEVYEEGGTCESGPVIWWHLWIRGV